MKWVLLKGALKTTVAGQDMSQMKPNPAFFFPNGVGRGMRKAVKELMGF